MVQKNENKSPVIIESSSRANNNTVLIVIFSVVIFILLALAALGWGLFFYQKKKTDSTIKNLSPGIEKTNQTINSLPDSNALPSAPATEEVADPSQNIARQPQALPDEGFFPPTAGDGQVGYIKRVYEKDSKNYLDIDYIQWLSGTEAEKAMREDGQCPGQGECIVYNDYYIRNQNPLIRTFEISPDAKILMKTLDSETTGIVDQNKEITFDKFQDIFISTSIDQGRYKYVPFIVEINNKQIVKITEQYIP